MSSDAARKFSPRGLDDLLVGITVEYFLLISESKSLLFSENALKIRAKHGQFSCLKLR